MIKFLLGFVAIIVVLLAAYMFTNKPAETTTKETISKVKEQDVSKTEIDVAKVAEVKASKKVLSLAKPSKDVSQGAIQNTVNTEANGFTHNNTQDVVVDFSEVKDLTLKDIENSDMSDEEKENMIYKLMEFESYKAKDEPSITEEEGLKLLENL